MTAFINLEVAYAQKQPSVQEVGVRAPANIKIDGKLDEWPNKLLSAYNSTSRIYYTIANDDENLYLVVRGFGQRVSRKALEGGLTFTISHSTGKKEREKAPDNVSISFPVPQGEKIRFDLLAQQRELPPLMKDTVANRRQIDSLIKVANAVLTARLKEIRVAGIKEIEDTSISVYNTQGIKAKMQFILMQPVVEIAIPLKYLGLSTTKPVKFSYNIKLSVPPPPPGFVAGAIADDPPTADEAYLENTTDFWGEYILAPKP
ncbi:hypothetical protein BEL04_22400 [Mucilaginibacter sp. PPCGB 2223]|nr:hypothetical protein BEL04_22400 [Mucilaginibacter sp. PPCGB 2223]